MEQISKVRKCYKCGITLQSEDPSKEGYVSAEVLNNPNQNFTFCLKCFEEERFHSLSNEPYIDEEFLEVLKQAVEKNCLIVYVVNLYSFETSFSKEVIDIVKDARLMVVGTKFDLLPEEVTRENTADYVAHRCRVAGLNINSNDVYIVSKKDPDSVRETLTQIFELKNAKDVFVIGSQDAGKTALINAFLKIYSNLSNGNIVTHNYKDTHLKVMEIPLTNKSSMYETPGISITNSFLFGLDNKALKELYLTKKVEAREITLSKGQSIFIGGLGIVELVSGDKLDLKCYFHENLDLYKNRFADLETKFVKLVKKGELTPSFNKIQSTKDMEVFEISFNYEKFSSRDIGFTGLGWITAAAKKQTIRVYVPKGVSIYTSRPKVK